MSTTDSLQLIVAVFDSEQSANSALKTLKKARQDKQLDIQGAALMVKDADDGQIHYKDVGLTPGRGALGGVVLGVALGLLSGGTGLVLGAAGALLGGLMGRKKQDSRLPANRINQVAASLEPGASAIVVVVEHDWLAAVESELDALDADILVTEISADIARQLEPHSEAAFDALSGQLKPADSEEGSD